MRVVGTFDTLKKAWPSAVSHDQPKLYVCDNNDRVTKVYPIPGTFYEWTLSDKPSEDVFLSHYGFAHRVEAVNQ